MGSGDSSLVMRRADTKKPADPATIATCAGRRYPGAGAVQLAALGAWLARCLARSTAFDPSMPAKAGTLRSCLELMFLLVAG